MDHFGTFCQMGIFAILSKCTVQAPMCCRSDENIRDSITLNISTLDMISCFAPRAAGEESGKAVGDVRINLVVLRKDFMSRWQILS